MSLQLYNTLTRQKEEFAPRTPGQVGLYTCGPTVYNYPHIGNYRAYIFADILKRVLLYNGYRVHHIMNLTDVDDKTIRESQKERRSLKEFTEFYTQEFYKDVRMLGILPPEKYTRATDYIEAMVTLIQKLLTKGFAYQSPDGSVYFNIKKFKNYGKLSHITLDKQKGNASGRIKTDEYDKDNVQDFALWKAWDEKDGDVFWNTPLGKGRPGWHIECSAMSMENLGQQFDLHTGGVDNIFPHHENEIAQSEGATGKPFVKYWLHNEWLLVDNKKMAKSFGNFYTLRDLIDRGISPLAYRYFCLGTHYRKVLNFSLEAVQGAASALETLQNKVATMGNAQTGCAEFEEKFMAAVNDDLNTPKGLAVVWELMKSEYPDTAKKQSLLKFDEILGLGLKQVKPLTVPTEVQHLVAEREQARAQKNWVQADRLRQTIAEHGFALDDTELGPITKPLTKA